MNWTFDQITAINLAISNYQNHEKFTFISGVAGSGKTTILLGIINKLKLPYESVKCLTYTGKASLVLASKGLPNVSTIHSFLYYPVMDQQGKVMGWRKKLANSFEHIKLIIIDEISMVPRNIWLDLINLGIHIICTGDIEQLPPVDNSYLINWKRLYRNRPCYIEGDIACDYHMTEITRQARDSDIIKQSLLVRSKGANAFLSQRGYQSNEVSIIKMNQVTPELLISQDIILTATNRTRKLMNRVIRSLRYPNLLESELDLPQQDDILICLSNNWDIVNLGGNPIINGLRGRLQGYTTRNLSSATKGTIIKMTANFLANENLDSDNQTPDDLFIKLNLNYHDLLGEELTEPDYLRLGEPLHIDYGYAISCHKAQGSEWDKVMIIEEPWPTGELRKKWWYTALTRAKSRVTVVTRY